MKKATSTITLPLTFSMNEWCLNNKVQLQDSMEYKILSQDRSEFLYFPLMSPQCCKRKEHTFLEQMMSIIL